MNENITGSIPPRSRRNVKVAAASIFALLMLFIGWGLHAPAPTAPLVSVVPPGLAPDFALRIRDLKGLLAERDKSRSQDWLGHAGEHYLQARGELLDWGGASAAGVRLRRLRKVTEWIAGSEILYALSESGPDRGFLLVVPDGPPFLRWIRSWLIGKAGLGKASSKTEKGWFILRSDGFKQAESGKSTATRDWIELLELAPVTGAAGMMHVNPEEAAWVRDVESIRFVSTGNGLGDWRFVLGGDLQAMKQWISRPEAPASEVITDMQPGNPVIVQLESRLGFVHDLGNGRRIDLEEILDKLKEYDWLRPNLAESLESIMQGIAADPTRRDISKVGIALLPTSQEAVPTAAIWNYDTGWERPGFPPGPMTSDDLARSQITWRELGKPVFTDREREANLPAQRLAAKVWDETDHTRVFFAAVDYSALAESMAAFPAITLGSDKRASWMNALSIIRGLREALGATAMVLEEKDGVLVGRIESLQ